MPSPSSSPLPAGLAARLTRTARTWTDVTVHPHPTARLAFRVEDALVGHLHSGDTLAVPLPAPVRATLIDHGLAHPVPTAPDWVTHPLVHADDLPDATQLLRLSYLYRRLLRTRDATALHRIRTELTQCALPAPRRAVYDAMLAERGASAPPSS